MTDFLDHSGDSYGDGTRDHGLPADLSAANPSDSASFFTEWQLERGDDESTAVTD